MPVANSPYTSEPAYLQGVERVRKLFEGELIGFGGMGVVYRAQHTELGRTVALKTPRPGLADGSQVIERFRRELQSIGQLQHRHVVAAPLDGSWPRG
jgi:eukaryotic-like serine/threonine-protein kinase